MVLRTVEDVDRDSLEPGRRYRVSFQDCGLEGGFTATFLGWGRYEWDDSAESAEPSVVRVGIEDGAEFSLWDNGLRLGPVEGYWTAYRAD